MAENPYSASYGTQNSTSGQSGNGSDINSGTGFDTNAGLNFALNQGGSYGETQSSGGSFSSGSSQGTSSSTQDIWAGQSPFLTSVYNAAQGQYGLANDQVQAMQPGVQQQVNNAAALGNLGYANQMMGGAAGQLGPSQAAQMQSSVGQLGPTQASQLGPSAQGAMQGGGLQQQMLNNYNGNNPYMAGMKDMIAADAQRLKQQNLGSLDARAAAAGMSGSSGYRNQVSDMMENVDENAMNAMTNMGYQANNQAIQDRIRLSGAADQMNMGAAGAQDRYNMQLAGMNDQSALQRANIADQFNMQAANYGDQYGMQQAGMIDSNVNNAYGNTGMMQQAAMNQFNPSMVGMNLAGQYGQIIGGPTTLTQSESQNSSSQSGGSSQQSSGWNMGFQNAMSGGVDMGNGLNYNNGYGNNVSTGASNSNSDNYAIGG